MTLLLDTQLLLWSQAEPHRLPMAVSKELENPDSAPYFSALVQSSWISIDSATAGPDEIVMLSPVMVNCFRPSV